MRLILSLENSNPFSAGFALGLELVEEFLVFLDVAADAGFVEREKLDVSSVGEPDPGIADRGVAFGSVDVGGVADGALDGHGEEVVLDGSGAVEAPHVFGYGHSQDVFAKRFGFDVGHQAVAEGVEGSFVFVGEGVELTC